MKRYRLERFVERPVTTHGQLYGPSGEWLCFTLEDAVREVKIPGRTAIPTGSYTLTLRTEGGMNSRYTDKYGTRHHGMIWLRGDDAFEKDWEWVYFHKGNDAGQ